MWYEALFPFSIYVALISMPAVLMPISQQWQTNSKYVKDTDDFYIRRYWFRDLYLTGKGYEATSIDAIPDLPETKK